MKRFYDRRVKGFRAIDEQTGEAFAILVAPMKRGIGGRWMRVFQDTQTRLALDRSIHGETRRILSFLMGESDFQNRVPGPTAVGKKMGLSQSLVSRAYAELKRTEVLIVKDGDYYLSPLLCWKGSERELEAAYQRFFFPLPALPPARNLSP